MSKQIKLNPVQTVLVVGGYGFIGSAIVEHLENYGASVLVGSRCTQLPRKLGARKVILHELHDQKQFEILLKGVDVVINAVGILRQRKGETYEQVHHLAVENIVNACAEKNVRFVHVSALGLENPAKSKFLNSKLRGENAIKRSKADWYICRPSLVDGEGGYGAKWLRRVAQWPIHIAPANALGILAPINILDLGDAIAKIALNVVEAKTTQQRIYELGGEQKVSLFQYLQLLKKEGTAFRFKIPAWIARLVSHLFDALHLTPFSFGHYELLKFDNYPKSQQTTLLLGRRCSRLGEQSQSEEDPSFCSSQPSTQNGN